MLSSLKYNESIEREAENRSFCMQTAVSALKNKPFLIRLNSWAECGSQEEGAAMRDSWMDLNCAPEKKGQTGQ